MRSSAYPLKTQSWGIGADWRKRRNGGVLHCKSAVRCAAKTNIEINFNGAKRFHARRDAAPQLLTGAKRKRKCVAASICGPVIARCDDSIG